MRNLNRLVLALLLMVSFSNVNAQDAPDASTWDALADDINMDGTGTPWDYLDGWVKRISMTGPDGAIFSIASWTFSGINMLEGDTNAATLSPFPIGGFTP